MLFKEIYKVNEQSILKSTRIVEWKRSRGFYNFKNLPEIAIIALDKKVFSKRVIFQSKRIKGIPGLGYSLKSRVLLCSEFGSGSPALILLLEELGCLGVKKIIFIGSAGIIEDDYIEGDACIISIVKSLVGSSFYYSNKENIPLCDLNWSKEVASMLGLKFKKSLCVDAPYRETPSIISFGKKNNLSLVEMETAGLYAFSEFYDIPSISILIGADRLSEDDWQPPQHLARIIEHQKMIIDKLLKYFI